VCAEGFAGHCLQSAERAATISIFVRHESRFYRYVYCNMSTQHCERLIISWAVNGISYLPDPNAAMPDPAQYQEFMQYMKQFTNSDEGKALFRQFSAETGGMVHADCRSVG